MDSTWSGALLERLESIQVNLSSSFRIRELVVALLFLSAFLALSIVTVARNSRMKKGCIALGVFSSFGLLWAHFNVVQFNSSDLFHRFTAVGVDEADATDKLIDMMAEYYVEQLPTILKSFLLSAAVMAAFVLGLLLFVFLIKRSGKGKGLAIAALIIWCIRYMIWPIPIFAAVLPIEVNERFLLGYFVVYAILYFLPIFLCVFMPKQDEAIAVAQGKASVQADTPQAEQGDVALDLFAVQAPQSQEEPLDEPIAESGAEKPIADELLADELPADDLVFEVDEEIVADESTQETKK